jgi:uncharacterized protein
MPVIRSIAFPFMNGDQSFPREATDFDAIKASIIQIVCTGKGSRVMRGSFGCSAFDFVFENDSDLFRIQVEREVRTSLAVWEPRVRIDSIDIETNSATEPGQILITINYTVISADYQDSVTVGG